MYAATLNILQQFLGLWAEVIPQKLFVCENIYNKHQFPITSHFINFGWFHQRSKFLPQHTKYALLQHRMVPMYDENNMNDQFLYLNVTLSNQPMNKQ